jgi:hypothetical protein
MAARLAPDNVRRTHQSLHHLVADAPWNDEEMLAEVRRYVLPTMQKHGPVVAWIVDDTGFPKRGQHSVGVARQYCGQLGKSDNCQALVGEHVEFEFAHRVALIPAGSVVSGCQALSRSRRSGGDGVSNQARDLRWSRYGKR